MTDRPFDSEIATPPGVTSSGPRRYLKRLAKSEMLRDLYQDFRAVPVEAWIILAVATVMSNLFIALA